MAFALEPPAEPIGLGLIDVAGLEIEALYGGFNREPFTDESLEFVYVTRKP